MTTMKIWKIVFVLLTAFSLASCDKEDENNMMLTAIESIASTQWSLNRQATHREGKTVIEKFDTESAYRYVYDFRETDYQIICYPYRWNNDIRCEIEIGRASCRERG